VHSPPPTQHSSLGEPLQIRKIHRSSTVADNETRLFDGIKFLFLPFIGRKRMILRLSPLLEIFFPLFGSLTSPPLPRPVLDPSAFPGPWGTCLLAPSAPSYSPFRFLRTSSGVVYPSVAESSRRHTKTRGPFASCLFPVCEWPRFSPFSPPLCQNVSPSFDQSGRVAPGPLPMDRF